MSSGFQVILHWFEKTLCRSQCHHGLFARARCWLFQHGPRWAGAAPTASIFWRDGLDLWYRAIFWTPESAWHHCWPAQASIYKPSALRSPHTWPVTAPRGAEGTQLSHQQPRLAGGKCCSFPDTAQPQAPAALQILSGLPCLALKSYLLFMDTPFWN